MLLQREEDHSVLGAGVVGRRNFLEKKRGLEDAPLEARGCTFDAHPVVVLDLVVGIDRSLVNAPEEPGRYTRERLLRVVHVALANGQGLHEQSGGLLQILEWHLKNTHYHFI